MDPDQGKVRGHGHLEPLERTLWAGAVNERAVAGTVIALRSADRFGRLLAIGITTWLATQAIVNIGGVTGILPITGVPLPFVSFGGTALVMAMVGVGVLVSVARHHPEVAVTVR